MKQKILSGKTLFLFDLDGVFYRGKESRVLIGGADAVRVLRKKGKNLCILTNNSTDTSSTVYSRLREFGIDVRREEVLTSARLTAEYLRDRYGSVRYFLVGERGLDTEMRSAGHRRTRGDKADFVVLGLDRALTYDKLDQAARVVRGGAKIAATHAARLYMSKDGPALATGPIVRALEYATNKRAIVVGKPSPLMFRIALSRWNCAKSKAVMVGDQIETDLVGAARAGIDSILVTTGVDKSPGASKPVAVLPNVDDILSLI